MLNMFIRIITLVSILAVASAKRDCWLDEEARGETEIYYSVKKCGGDVNFETIVVIKKLNSQISYSAATSERCWNRATSEGEARNKLVKFCNNAGQFEFNPITGPTRAEGCSKVNPLKLNRNMGRPRFRKVNKVYPEESKSAEVDGGAANEIPFPRGRTEEDKSLRKILSIGNGSVVVVHTPHSQIPKNNPMAGFSKGSSSFIRPSLLKREIVKNRSLSGLRRTHVRGGLNRPLWRETSETS